MSLESSCGTQEAIDVPGTLFVPLRLVHNLHNHGMDSGSLRDTPLTFHVYIERDAGDSEIDYEGGIQALFDDPDIEVTYLPPIDRDALESEDLAGADAFISRSKQVTAETLDGLDDLKIITRSGAGFDNLDLDACTAHGVVATHAPQGPTDAVAETTMSLMVTLTHNLREFEQLFHEESFQAARRGTLGHLLSSRTLGLVGLGRIARRFLEYVAPLEMDVIAYDPYVSQETAAELGVELVDLDGLLARADIISIHVPLTPETQNMLGEEEFRQMKETAYLVNTSRGGIYPDAELARAIEEGWIAGAAIDVFEDEPDVAGNPLLSVEDCITLPHIAGRAVETYQRTGQLMTESILNVKNGEFPINILNPDVYDDEVPRENLSPAYRPD